MTIYGAVSRKKLFNFEQGDSDMIEIDNTPIGKENIKKLIAFPEERGDLVLEFE
jgi:hypothetical protein